MPLNLEACVLGEPVRQPLYVFACEVDDLPTAGADEVVMMFLGSSKEVCRLPAIDGYLTHHMQVCQHAQGAVDRNQSYIASLSLNGQMKLCRSQVARALNEGLDDCAPLRRELVAFLLQNSERRLSNVSRCHSAK